MIELVAKSVVEGDERHVVLVEEDYSEEGHPFTVWVQAHHYSAQRSTVEHAYYWTLDEAQTDCRVRFGVGPEDWRPLGEARFEHAFQFEYGVTDRGVPQPFVTGFEGAEVVFRLSKVEHFEEPATPVISISGNKTGLQRLAAILLLCADAENYDSDFHVHLDRENYEQGQTAFFTGDVPVTVRSPSYLEVLKANTFREISVKMDISDETENESEDEE